MSGILYILEGTGEVMHAFSWSQAVSLSLGSLPNLQTHDAQDRMDVICTLCSRLADHAAAMVQCPRLVQVDFGAKLANLGQVRSKLRKNLSTLVELEVGQLLNPQVGHKLVQGVVSTIHLW